MAASTRASSPVRERMLADAVAYVLDRGLIGFSLRPLAAEIGTSDRMLLYHFGSKENLVSCIVARANESLTASVTDDPVSATSSSVRDVIRVAWEYLSTENGRKISRLYVEICALSLRDPDRWAATHRDLRRSWAGLMTAATRDVQPDSARRSLQRLVVCTIDGLILDALTTGETHDVASALEQFVTLLDGTSRAPAASAADT